MYPKKCIAITWYDDTRASCIIIYVQSIQVLHAAFRGPIMAEMNLGHSSLIYVFTNTHPSTHRHTQSHDSTRSSPMYTCMYRHVHTISKILYRCFLKKYSALVYILTHCVTVVFFIHSYIIGRLIGGHGNVGWAALTLSSAVLFILTPPAIRLGRCLSQIPALHVRNTRSLIDTNQWYTHFVGAKVDIWTAETKVKHGSALIHAR